MKKSELLAMVVTELKALAKKMKVSLPSGATKAEFVAALSTAFKKAETKKTGAVKAKTVKTVKKVAAAGKTAVRKRTTAAKPVEAPRLLLFANGNCRPGSKSPSLPQERVSEANIIPGRWNISTTRPTRTSRTAMGKRRSRSWCATRIWSTPTGRCHPRASNGEKMVRVAQQARRPHLRCDRHPSSTAGTPWAISTRKCSSGWAVGISTWGGPRILRSGTGLLSPEGRFLTLARSNHISMPRDGASDVLDEEWMLVDEEFWKLYGLPSGPSSPHIRR